MVEMDMIAAMKVATVAMEVAMGAEDTQGFPEMSPVAEDIQGPMATAMDMPAGDTHGLMA